MYCDIFGPRRRGLNVMLAPSPGGAKKDLMDFRLPLCVRGWLFRVSDKVVRTVPMYRRKGLDENYYVFEMRADDNYYVFEMRVDEVLNGCGREGSSKRMLPNGGWGGECRLERSQR